MAMNPTGANQGPQAPIMYDPHAPGAATGGPGSYNFGNSQNPTPPPTGTNQNPFQVPLPTMPVSMNPGTGTGATGTTATGVGGSTVTGGNAAGLNTQNNNALLRSLQENYGEGPGSLIFQFLQSGGGYNAPLAQQTVDATNKAMLQNIELGLGNLKSDLGGSGISADSSVSALETSNYESNAMTQMNAIDANIYETMWNQSQNRETQILEDTSKVSATSMANQPSVLGELTSFLGLGQTAAGGASGLVSAFNPGADTSILDALAGF